MRCPELDGSYSGQENDSTPIITYEVTWPLSALFFLKLRFWPLVMTRSDGVSVIGLTLWWKSEVWMTEVWSIVSSSLRSVNSVWGLDNFASTVRLHAAGESGSSHHADRLTAPCRGAGELQRHSVSLYADLHSSLRPPQFSLLGETPFVLLQQADGLLTAALQRTNHSSAPDLTAGNSLFRALQSNTSGK